MKNLHVIVQLAMLQTFFFFFSPHSYWMFIVILQLAGRGYLSHLSLILQLDCGVRIQHRISIFSVVELLI